MNCVARILQGAQRVSEVLDAALEALLTAIPAASHVSLSMVGRDDLLSTVAQSDLAAASADELQYALGDGPVCMAVAEKLVVWSDDLASDDRWGEYGGQAADLGFASQVAVHLMGTRRCIGAMNLYAKATHAFDVEAREIAELSASRVATALVFADQVEGLETKAANRAAIGEAVGIVMERYQLDEDAAFQYLVRLSQTGNTKLREVAEKLVASTTDD